MLILVTGATEEIWTGGILTSQLYFWQFSCFLTCLVFRIFLKPNGDQRIFFSYKHSDPIKFSQIPQLLNFSFVERDRKRGSRIFMAATDRKLIYIFPRCNWTPKQSQFKAQNQTCMKKALPVRRKFKIFYSNGGNELLDSLLY